MMDEAGNPQTTEAGYSQFDDYNPDRRNRRRVIWTVVGVLVVALAVALVVVLIRGSSDDDSSSSSGGSASVAQAVARAELEEYETRMRSMMDDTADPCNDFYQYSCGGFMKTNHIPPGGSSYVASFSPIAEQTANEVLDILEDRFPLVGSLYDSCLDTMALDQMAWDAGLRDMLDLIDNAQDGDALYSVAGGLLRQGLGANIFQPIYDTDFLTANKNVLYLLPGGVSIAQIDNSTIVARAKTVYAKLFKLSGETEAQAEESANSLVDIEIHLTNAFVDAIVAEHITSRDDFFLKAVKTPVASLDEATRDFVVALTRGPHGTGSVSEVSLLAHEAVPVFKTILTETASVAAFKAYLKGHLLSANVHAMPAAWRALTDEMTKASLSVTPTIASLTRNADGSFPEAIFRGTPFYDADRDAQSKRAGGVVDFDSLYREAVDRALRERREKRAQEEAERGGLRSNSVGAVDPEREAMCVNAMHSLFPDLLAHHWIRGPFPQRNADYVSDVLDLVYNSVGDRLRTVSWLDETTRTAAVNKWKQIQKNIAYNPNWGKYRNSDMSGQLMHDYREIATFLADRSAGLVGRVPDRTKFAEEDYTVQNAFYMPTANSINLLAGLLLKPFLNPDLPMMINLATYGYVAGHEITHGFDNSGRLYGPTGAFTSWWTQTAEDEFNRRAQCIVDQYDQYTVYNLHVNGQQTLGENIADAGGMGAAYNAFDQHARPDGDKPLFDGLTNDQAFFISAGQVWCAQFTEKAAKDRIFDDVHSPAKYRNFGPAANNPAFAHAFNCKASDVMGKSLGSNRCEVW